MTEEKRAYYKTRKSFTPRAGETYENEAGGTFLCVSGRMGVGPAIATMRNLKSGWQFIAHGVGIYEDGKIDWDYSTGGRFVA